MQEGEDSISKENSEGTVGSIEESVEFRQELKVLSEMDAQLLEESGKEVMRRLFEDYPDKLPDAIILPDSSARPLWYLMEPSFRKVASERGLSQIPQPYFVAFKADMSLIVLSEREDKGDAGNYEQRLKQAQAELEPVRQQFGNYNAMLTKAQDRAKTENISPAEIANLQGSINQLLLKRIETYSAMLNIQTRHHDVLGPYEARVNLKQRCDEIIQFLHKQGINNPNIVIVDDFISPRTLTVREIRRAFGNEGIKAYGFLSNTSEDDLNEQLKRNVAVGLVVPEGDNRGFNYRRSFGVGVEKNNDQLEAFKYSTPIVTEWDDPDEREEKSEQIKDLREDMVTIGQRIAATV